MTHQTETVKVDLGSRSYEIIIGSGLIGRIGDLIQARLGKVRVGIVADENTASLYADSLSTALRATEIDNELFVIAPGEASKSLSVFEDLVERVVGAKLERNDVLIALGGGVIGDLTGYVAASVRRGIGFVQVPTSLLSLVDSSVGGKTGINSKHGKNLIGAFYQPSLVVADIETLNTLPARELRAGYAEVVKYGLIDDPKFYEWLEQNHTKILVEGAADARIRAIARSCRAKAAIVAEDEHEKGKRALLNLGHTFGHALEGVTGYSDRLVHGEGVAIGMVLAHRFSAHMNLASPDDAMRVSAHLHEAGLPTSIDEIPGSPIEVDALMHFITQDKKVSRGALTFILTKGIGQAFVAKDVSPDIVKGFLQDAVGVE